MPDHALWDRAVCSGHCVDGAENQGPAEWKQCLVTQNASPSDAAHMRALAAQADAEAAEAEALAAAARARARALQLRRAADSVDSASAEALASVAEQLNGSDAHRDADTVTHDPAPDDENSNDPVDHESAHVPFGNRSDGAADGPAPRQRWRHLPTKTTLSATVVVLVVIASSAVSAFIVIQHGHTTQQHQRAAEFAAAAREGVVTLTSLDFSDAKAGVQRIIDNSTGSFKSDFAKMAPDFAKVVEQSKVIERGTVKAVAVDVDSMTNDSAVVLIASTSEVTNAAGAKQEPRNFKLIVTLTRDSDQLKMSKVEFVA
jgi:Mce-associated membrane protein